MAEDDKKEVAPKKATTKKKAPAKKKAEVEVPVEDSKSEVPAPAVLESNEPELVGGDDSEPAQDSRDGSVNEPAKKKSVRTSLWTS